MKIEEINLNNKEDFFHFWEIYNYSFPENEKRNLKEQKNIMQNKLYFPMFIQENNKVIAILCYWVIGEYYFVEHFAVKKELRGKRYGSKIFSFFIKDKSKIFLEIEKITDEITLKRFNFYKRLGFCKNDLEHCQIPFREGSEILELDILSYKECMDKKSYDILLQKMKKLLTAEGV